MLFHRDIDALASVIAVAMSAKYSAAPILWSTSLPWGATILPRYDKNVSVPCYFTNLKNKTKQKTAPTHAQIIETTAGISRPISKEWKSNTSTTRHTAWGGWLTSLWHMFSGSLFLPSKSTEKARPDRSTVRKMPFLSAFFEGGGGFLASIAVKPSQRAKQRNHEVVSRTWSTSLQV